MRRKVIQIANSTQLVSLPRAWCKQFDIKKGEELNVEEVGSKIEITTSKAIEIDSISFDLSKTPHIVPRIIHALYKKGYDQIDLNFNDISQLKSVQDMLRDDVIGYEMVSQHHNKCVIKSIAGTSGDEFNTMLRRTFLILESFSEEISRVLNEKNSSGLDTIRYMETINNRTTGFCRRVLNKYGNQDHKYISFIYCLVEELEKVADEYKYLCDYIKNNPDALKKINKDIPQLFKELNKFIKDTHSVFYKYDIEKLSNLFAHRKDIIDKSNKLYKSRSITVKDTKFLHYSVTICQLLANILSFILEIKL